MTPPNPTTTSSKRRRPVYTTFADGSRGRIDPPPPPGPTRKPISLAELEEICASWDFPRWGDQLAHTLDHAERLLYDTSTGPWEDERDRKRSLYWGIRDEIQNLVEEAGFTGMAAPGPTPFLYTAFYDPDEGVPQLPQCVQRLVTIKPLRGRGIAYRPDFPGMENVILRMYDGNTH
jgi:hypothetical protein